MPVIVKTGAGDLEPFARALADAVPSVIAALRASGSGRLHRQAMMLMERPLIAHALSLTGGNQLRAARLLGLNRNTLRKRCRELDLALPSAGRVGDCERATVRRPA